MILRTLFVLLIASVATFAQQMLGPTSASFGLAKQGDKKSFALYVPRTGALELVVRPARLQGMVSVTRSGSYGGQAMAVINVKPHADSLFITVSWKEPLVRGSRFVPPVSAPLLNAEWRESNRSHQTEKMEQAQGGVDPSLWYDPTQPHTRIETAFDGVATILADDVLVTTPELANADTSKLALMWRGTEQHLFIVDADGSNTFTSGDSIVFMGRHPQGDTSWLDVQDTTAVFFLTTRTPGTRLRMATLNVPGVTTQKVRSLFVNERIELDTGYYHPGSDNNEDYSTYATPLTRFEGFYWEALNGRAKQFATHTLRFTPSGEGDVSVTADVVASTNPSTYNPDHGIDVSVNGAPSVGVVGDGFARYDITSTTSGSVMPSGLQSVRLYATGIPGLDATPDWFSEVLLDAFTLKGLAAPVLENGRLRGRVTTIADAELMIENTLRGAAYVIDTTQWRIAQLATSDRGITVRAGISPVALSWPGEPRQAGQYDATYCFDNDHRVVGNIHGYVIASRSATSNVIRQVVALNAAECAAAINALSTDEIATVLICGGPITSPLISALQGKGVSISTEDTLCIVAISASTSERTGTTTEPTRGLRMFASSSRALGGIVRTTLPGNLNSVLCIGAGSGVERARVRAASLKNLRGSATKVDVLVVAHPSLRAQAERWADYRSKKNNIVTRVVSVVDIFDEFDAGRHSPEAVRLFLKDAWEKAPIPKPTHCVLFGTATWDVRVVVKGGNARSVRPDLVPTYGRPSSDYWFGLLDDPNDVSTPELIVSRFPVLNDAEARFMIDKIIVADSLAYSPWQRKFLYAGGGETVDEGLCQIYQDMLGDVFETGINYTKPTLCIDTVTICKSTSDNPGFEIRQNVNAGVALMNYIGHGGTEIFDIKGWDPEDLSNEGKYPVLATFSCLTGAFSNSSVMCRNGQYLLQPQAGFVAAIGATGWQYKIVVTQLLTEVHEVMRTTTIRDLGLLTYEAKRGMSESTQQFAINSSMQFAILGDPFTRVNIDTTPQVSIASDRVLVTSSIGGSQIREDDDSAFVDVTIWSEGIGTDLPYQVTLRHRYQNVLDSSSIVVPGGLCREETVRFVVNVDGRVGTHSLDIEVDPQGSFGDRRADNRVQATFDVFARSLLILQPDPYGIIDIGSVRARVIDILSTPSNTYKVEMVLSASQDTSTIMLRSLSEEITRDGSLVDWNTLRAGIGFAFEADAWLGVWAIDTTTQRRTAIAWMPVKYAQRPRNEPMLHEVGAVHAIREHPLIQTEPLIYDSLSRTIKIGSYNKNIFVRSSGVMTADPDRDPILNVTIGQATIFQSAFRSGLNIVVLGQRDSIPRIIRRYDTSPNPQPIEAGHNGFARECINFLRDSVANTDRVVIAACNESFTRFVNDDLLDSLKLELRRFGSRLCDSLNVASSFAFIGSRISISGKAQESWKGAPAFMVTIDSSLSFHYPSGKAFSASIGRARRWESVSFGSTGLVRSVLYGMQPSNGEAIVLDTTGTWTPSAGSAAVTHVSYVWELFGTEETPDASIGDITAKYEPLPQWIVEPDALTIQPDTILRGDTARVSVRIRNARTGFNTPTSKVMLHVHDALTNDIVGQQSTEFSAIAANGVFNVTLNVPSNVLPTRSRLLSVLDIDPTEPELFIVRDRAERLLTISEDNTKPTIEPYVDGRYLSEGGWVYREPRFEIRVRDDSPLSISDPERMIVFVNGQRIRQTSADGYQFLTTQEAQIEWPNSDVRAAMRFRFPLELGQNLLIVRATDASNNSDTLEIPLYTSTETRLDGVTIAPNPTSGSVTFIVALVSDVLVSQASMGIYDVQGRLVRSLTGDVQMGEGRVEWDGRGDAGEVLAPGVYAWNLMVLDASGGTKTTTSGTLVIVR